MNDTSREIICVAVREDVDTSQFVEYPVVAGKVVCSDCGVVYVIWVKNPDLVKFSLADRYHTFLEGEFIHDHVEHDKHRGSIAIPAALKLPSL